MHVAFDETNSVVSKIVDDEVSENVLEKQSIYEDTEKEEQKLNDEKKKKKKKINIKIFQKSGNMLTTIQRNSFLEILQKV